MGQKGANEDHAEKSSEKKSASQAEEQQQQQQQPPPQSMPQQPFQHGVPEPNMNGSLDGMMVANVLNDSIQFGGYNTQEMPQQQMFMNQGLMPPPNGMGPPDTSLLPQPIGLGPPGFPSMDMGGLTPDNVPESDVTSKTRRSGDVLRNPNQMSSVWKSLISLWDERILVDLKLKPQPCEKTISVHAVVIAACAPAVANALIKTKGERAAIPQELVVHCEYCALEECVRYCYTGELRISDELLAKLWYAGSVLEMQDVLDLCCQWAQTHIHAGNAHTINSLADQYCASDLKSAVDRYVLTNMQSLVQEDEFLLQPLERITELLSSDDATFDGELEVFSAVARWIDHDKPNRTQHLALLMNTTVRLPQLDFDELEKVELNELVATDNQAKSLMHDVYRYLAAPTQRRLQMEIPGTRPRNNMLNH